MKTVRTVRELIKVARCDFAPRSAVKVKRDGEYVSYTYEALCRDSRRVGRALCSRGLIGKRIIICGENGYEWVTAYLAVTGYCGIAVPLSGALTRDEFTEAVGHCDAEAVIYGEGCEELISELPGGIVKIPFSSLSGMTYAKGTPLYTPSPDDIAELAYSSGTEGRARAVILSHKNICHSLTALGERIKTDENDRFYSVLPLTHLNERIFGLLCPLASGASVAYGDGLHKIKTNMKQVRPTVMICVPFIIDKIYSKIMKNIEEKNKTKAVSRVVTLTEKAGAVKKALRRAVFAQIHESLGGRLRFFLSVGDSVKYKTQSGLEGLGFDTVQSYGLAESAALISVNAGKGAGIAVGRPIESGLTDIYNVQSDGVGEIRYKGENVTRGYYGSAAETEEHIRDGWLYTGDMGYIDGDGFLHVIGRKGNIIAAPKGKQIYPEELESALALSRYVRECAVVGVPNRESGEYDTAAVIYPEGSRLAEKYGEGYTEAAVKQELCAAVDRVNEGFSGTHKRISRFKVTDIELPKTADGKIIRSMIEKNM